MRVRDRRPSEIPAHIGIALYPTDAESADSVIANAEIAMLRARREGSAFRYYTSKMNSAAAERLELEAALRRALERDELRVGRQDGTVRTTSSQDLLFRWVLSDEVGELYRRLAAAGLGLAGADSVTDMTSCPGAESCFWFSPIEIP